MEPGEFVKLLYIKDGIKGRIPSQDMGELWNFISGAAGLECNPFMPTELNSLELGLGTAIGAYQSGEPYFMAIVLTTEAEFGPNKAKYHDLLCKYVPTVTLFRANQNKPFSGWLKTEAQALICSMLESWASFHLRIRCKEEIK